MKVMKRGTNAKKKAPCAPTSGHNTYLGQWAALRTARKIGWDTWHARAHNEKQTYEARPLYDFSCKRALRANVDSRWNYTVESH